MSYFDDDFYIPFFDMNIYELEKSKIKFDTNYLSEKFKNVPVFETYKVAESGLCSLFTIYKIENFIFITTEGFLAGVCTYSETSNSYYNIMIGLFEASGIRTYLFTRIFNDKKIEFCIGSHDHNNSRFWTYVLLDLKTIRDVKMIDAFNNNEVDVKWGLHKFNKKMDLIIT